MHQERFSARFVTQTVMYILGVLAYGLVLLSIALPVTPGVTLSCVAMAMLGGAVAWLVTTRVGHVAEPRLGARAQTAWRRYRTLALITVAWVYLALVFGTVVTSSGGVWECTTVPLCPSATDLSVLTIAHRGIAALATVLVAVVMYRTFATRTERALKQAAAWSFGLITVQNVIGLVQVVFAQQGSSLPVSISRMTHLAFGALTWSAVVALGTLAVRVPPAKRDEGATAVRDSSQSRRWADVVKDYVSLTKPGVISLLIFTTFAAMFITPAGIPSFSLVFWTLLGGWLMPAGAHALNCYFDRDIDVLMGRTGRRPIPSGRIPPWHALVLGMSLAVVAFTILAVFVNLVTALLALAGFFYYVVIYTLVLKRSTFNNIVIGGGAGAFPPLVGWAAVTGSLTLPSLFLFAIIFYWTPPHFWALALIRQKDYANAGVPMLPVVAGDAETKRQILFYTLMMIALTVMPTPLGMFGVPYLAMALGLGGMFLYYVLRMLRADSTAARWGLYRFSLLYLFLLFVAMMVDRIVFV